MSDKSDSTDYVPLEMTDEFMVDLFKRVQEHQGFRPWKNEVEQFFQSRIWKIVEEEATLKLAQLFSSMLKPSMSEVEHAEVAAAIRIMSWWLNLENNIFAARMRTMETDAFSPGGESWKP